jgi:hypothetical protein
MFAPQTFTARESGQNILSGIHIMVVVGGAGRTIPRPDIQWQLLHNVTTMPTPFRTRKPAVYLDKVATIPVALIFKLSDQLTPTSITDGLGQFPILDHILHSQIQGRRWRKFSRTNRVVNLLRKSCRASLISAWILATLRHAL